MSCQCVLNDTTHEVLFNMWLCTIGHFFFDFFWAFSMWVYFICLKDFIDKKYSLWLYYIEIKVSYVINKKIKDNNYDIKLNTVFSSVFCFVFFSVQLLSGLRGHSVFSSTPQRPMTSDFFIHYIIFLS